MICRDITTATAIPVAKEKATSWPGFVHERKGFYQRAFGLEIAVTAQEEVEIVRC